MAVHGLILAAGAGRRFGGPKALARAVDGTPWVRSVADALLTGGVSRITVVLGAAAGGASALVPDDPRVDVVFAPGWEEGIGASLRAGIAHVMATDDASVAVAIVPVDLPGIPAAAVERLVTDASPAVLRQAVYDGRPGHPVVVGRDHWRAFAASLHGDHGGRAYLAAHGVAEVECSDLWDGRDVDR